MPRNKNSKVTVNRILDSATKLFLEKGYESTTIQDIVDDLGDLSKGAIYHHFKGKEEIVEAVGMRLFSQEELKQVVNIEETAEGTNLTGLERIQKMILYCLKSPFQIQLMHAMPNILKNPKFLALQLDQSVREVAPMMVSLVEEGISDGSITTKYPGVISEAFLMLANIWLNPLIFYEQKDIFLHKIMLVKEMLDAVGFSVINDEMIDASIELEQVVDNIEGFDRR